MAYTTQSLLINQKLMEKIMNNIFEIKLYSPQEARKLLGIGKNMMYRLVAQGKIDYVNLAGKIRITEDAIKDFLAKNTIRSARQRLYPNV